MGNIATLPQAVCYSQDGVFPSHWSGSRNKCNLRAYPEYQQLPHCRQSIGQCGALDDATHTVCFVGALYPGSSCAIYFSVQVHGPDVALCLFFVAANNALGVSFGTLYALP